MTNMACDLQPVDLHGSHGREYATGRGAVLATRELLLHAHAGKIANKDFVIQVCVSYSHFAMQDQMPCIPFDQSCIGFDSTSGLLLLSTCRWTS